MPITWNDDDVVVAQIAARLLVNRLTDESTIEAVRLARELLEEAARQKRDPVKRPEPAGV